MQVCPKKIESKAQKWLRSKLKNAKDVQPSEQHHKLRLVHIHAQTETEGSAKIQQTATSKRFYGCANEYSISPSGL